MVITPRCCCGLFRNHATLKNVQSKSQVAFHEHHRAFTHLKNTILYTVFISLSIQSWQRYGIPLHLWDMPTLNNPHDSIRHPQFDTTNPFYIKWLIVSEICHTTQMFVISKSMIVRTHVVCGSRIKNPRILSVTFTHKLGFPYSGIIFKTVHINNVSGWILLVLLQLWTIQPVVALLLALKAMHIFHLGFQSGLRFLFLELSLCCALSMIIKLSLSVASLLFEKFFHSFDFNTL